MNYLILDLETVPDLDIYTPVPGPDGQPVFPPVWAHRVVAAGCCMLDHQYRFQKAGVMMGGEQHILARLSKFVASTPMTLVTWNGRGFDLPVIVHRSLRHGIPIPWYYNQRGMRHRFSEDGHLDLCDFLSDHGASRSSRLDHVSKLIGGPGKSGNGSSVEQMYLEHQYDKIIDYCYDDIAITTEVFLRLLLIRGQVTPEVYAGLGVTAINGFDRHRPRRAEPVQLDLVLPESGVVSDPTVDPHSPGD